MVLFVNGPNKNGKQHVASCKKSKFMGLLGILLNVSYYALTVLNRNMSCIFRCNEQV